MGPLFGSMNALIAEIAGHTYRVRKVHAEGMMFSCSTVGVKVGGGVGSAICGWLLSAAGFIGTAGAQTAGVLNAIKFGFGALPVIITVLIVVCLWLQKVTQANAAWDAEHESTETADVTAGAD